MINRIYWRLRVVLLALRWLNKYNLGDHVWYEGRQWMLIQGRCAPRWDLSRRGVIAPYVHEQDFRKVRSLGNYWHSFISGYRFYMQSWFHIWVRGGIQPWMRECNIWGRRRG